MHLNVVDDRDSTNGANEAGLGQLSCWSCAPSLGGHSVESSNVLLFFWKARSKVWRRRSLFIVLRAIDFGIPKYLHRAEKYLTKDADDKYRVANV